MKASASVMRHLPKPLFKLLLMSLFYRGHGSRKEALEAFRVRAPRYLAAGGAAALIRQIEQLRTSDTLAVADALRGLGIPARIVWGDGDQFQKISYGERFSRDLPAPLRRIPGGKHFTPEDHPEIIAEEIMVLAEEARL
jgi:pimeloyl-ACP methyl ester carboxylesterase